MFGRKRISVSSHWKGAGSWRCKCGRQLDRHDQSKDHGPGIEHH